MPTYAEAANRYLPSKGGLRVLFVAESPPYYRAKEQPRYFYFETIAGREYLFRNMMTVLFSEDLNYALETGDKRRALERFRDEGFFLISAMSAAKGGDEGASH